MKLSQIQTTHDIGKCFTHRKNICPTATDTNLDKSLVERGFTTLQISARITTMTMLAALLKTLNQTSN